MVTNPCPFCGFASYFATCSQCGMDARTALWWLSFSNADGPLGVAVVQAPGVLEAVVRSHELGINPGGEVAFFGPLPDSAIGPEWRDRLLSEDEAHAIPDPDKEK
jgi:hypothetical protein